MHPRFVGMYREACENALRTGRWTPSRKDALLKLVDAGKVTPAEAFQRFGFSTDEIDGWRRRRARFGMGGLKATHLQTYGHAHG